MRSTRPATMRMTRPASVARSTVHHQSPTRLRSARDIMVRAPRKAPLPACGERASPPPRGGGGAPPPPGGGGEEGGGGGGGGGGPADIERQRRQPLTLALRA